MGSIRRTPPRALHLAAMLAAAAALALPQVADSRPTSITTGGAVPPVTPTGLTVARTPTNTAPSLAWSVSGGASSYRVYRNGSQIAKVTTTSFSDAGLAASGSYQYAVRAVSKSNTLSSLSTTTGVVYDIAAPTLVTGLTGPAETSGPVDLRWSPVTDAGGSGLAGYTIFRDGAPLGQTTATSFTDGTLPSEGMHSYQVRAEDAAGNHSSQYATLAVTVDHTAPVAPASVVAAASPTSTSPVLTWTASSDAGSGISGYRLLRNGVVVASVTSTSYVDAAAPAGSDCYAVQAIDKAGNLSPSSPAVTVTVDRTPPTVPVVSAGAAATSGTPQLDWADSVDVSSGVDHYRVIRDGAAIATPSASAFSDGSATADGSYVYTVTAVDAAGNQSAVSAAVTVTVDTTPPGAPASVSAVSPTTSAPQISWQAPVDAGSGVAGYRVLREGIAIATSAATSYTDPSLIADGSYTYAVRAVDRAGNVSAPSAARTVTFSQPVTQADIVTGVSARLSTSSTGTQDGKFPNIKLLSPFFRWSDLEPQNGVFSWTALDADIARARTSGNRLIVRISCGADAPAWLYDSTSSGGRPVTRLDLISTDPGSISGSIAVPAPWDADLLYHYRNLIQALQTHLSGFGDASQTWRLADYVYFVPVSMPTEVGSEMPLAFGQGTYTGTYKGINGTWNVHDTNQAEWFAHATGATTAEKLTWLQTQVGQAWKNAVDVHMQVLTAAPSAVAYGGLLGDGLAAARWIAINDVSRYPTRLWSMTTNLQPQVHADGTLGPYSEWSGAYAGAILLALQSGGVVGFQAAGPKLLSDCGRMGYSLNDAVQNYQMRFYEAAPSQVSLCSPLLLTDVNNLQSRLAARWGG
ncbi:MAG: large repetitive protein [Gaiellales bacterium]|nr:large repetitive protein [Gaiellales bacterium]